MALDWAIAHPGVTSGFELGGIPAHPILVNFTAALVPASLLSDVLFRFFKRSSLGATAWWTLLYASLITPATALAGWAWLCDLGEVQDPRMAIHKWLGTALALALVGLCWWRWNIYRSARPPSAPYLVVATIVVAALTLQGHLGGLMSFAGPSERADFAPRQATQPTTGSGGAASWQPYIDVSKDP